MGTRSLIGFFYLNLFYVLYNQFDGYPDGMGRLVVGDLQNAIQANRLDEYKRKLPQTKRVREEDVPTEEDINNLTSTTCLSVGNQSTSDYYCLLRGCQGQINSIIDTGYVLNHVDENGQPGWEEYAYIVNLDTMKLDFYVGSSLNSSYDFDNLPDW